MLYTVQERIQLVTWHLQGCSSREVCDHFAALYPDRPVPSFKTITNLTHRFQTTGCLADGHVKQSRTKAVSTDENTLLVCAAIENDPSISLRNLETDLGLNRESCRLMLKSEKYKSFKKIRCQKLHPGDNYRRMVFCEAWSNKINRNPRCHYKILFTDECTVYLDGHINTQNERIWATENPKVLFEKHAQVRQKVNVWAGILGTRIIGPFFFEGNVNGDAYLNFLRTVVRPTIDDLHLQYNITFMHDGHPAHGAAQVTRYSSN